MTLTHRQLAIITSCVKKMMDGANDRDAFDMTVESFKYVGPAKFTDIELAEVYNKLHETMTPGLIEALNSNPLYNPIRHQQPHPIVLPPFPAVAEDDDECPT